MENKHSKNSKQKFIIIGVVVVIVAIIAVAGGYFIPRQIRINEAEKKVEETKANLKNILNGGITNKRE